MDEAILAIGAIGFFLLGPWVLVWLGRRRRLREREEDRAQWGELTQRIYLLEHVVEQLKKSPPAFAPTAAAEDDAHRNMPEPQPSPELQAVVIHDYAGAEMSTEVPEPETFETAPPPHPLIPEHPLPEIPTLPTPKAMLTMVERYKSVLNLEERMGTDWLNKLGIVLLVIGVAFFLVYQLKTLGPAGKVLVGYLASAVVLGAGIWAERSDRYRILARAGVGGGWALLFFTTYAMYHVPAAHVLSSQTLDLVLMLGVATVMVWHTLRYRSQVVTGLAFLLAFLTVSISHSNVYSLTAGGVLAAGLVFIVLRMQWFELEIFGILASYFNHFLWLQPIIEPMQGHRRPFPEFAASAALLVVYWVIFRFSYLIRKPQEQRQERISTIAALLNTTLLLLLFKYQSTHPEWAFWALLAIGGVETAVGQLPRLKSRRTAVIVLSTLGVVLLIAAFPFRYSGSRLSVLWLLEAEALLLIGVWTREIVFRRLGMLATLLAAGQIFAYDAVQILGRRMDGADVRSDWPVAIMFLVAAAAFYVDSHWILKRWSGLFIHIADRTVMRQLSYVGCVMILTGAWMAFPEAWTAVAWCAIGVALSICAHRFKTSDLGYQANFAALVAVIRAFAINIEVTKTYHGVSIRLLSTVLVAVLLYVSSRWAWAGEPDRRFLLNNYAFLMRNWASGAYTWSASFLLALLCWYELRPVGVAVAWAVGGVLLLELGLTHKSVSLRLQAYLAFIAAFTRIFYVNLNAAPLPGEISPRFYTVLPLALTFFYAYWRLEKISPELTDWERKLGATSLCCYLGIITIAALVRFEVEADWVAAAWAALVVTLFAIAWRSRRRVFLHQAMLGTLAVLFRTALHNFYQRSYFPAPAWESRWITAGAVIALLFMALPISFRLRKQIEPSVESSVVRFLQNLERRPEQLVFFIAVGLLTVLLALEMRHGMVTLSWGLEGVAVFLLALWLGERSFRLAGLGLLLLCAVKILLVDVWRLSPSDRYLTLIVLGAALLLVSFLYTRNREKLRQYL